MLLFRVGRIRAALVRSWHMPRGASLSLEKAWELAHVWFDVDRGKPEWRCFTLEETEAVLARLALTSEVWNLR